MKNIFGAALILVCLCLFSALAQDADKFKIDTIDLGKGVKLEMVLIPSGKFKMGSPKKEKGRKDDEIPHAVTLTKPYYMAKFEVTQEQWQRVMGNNYSYTKGPKLPVTDVSWDECQEFVRKLNEKTAGGFRLPSEAEWEYACRAGSTTGFSYGNEISTNDANYFNAGKGKSIDVGRYKPNAFGLFDMHGNVSEWCEDWYGIYSEGPVSDPSGPVSGDRRVFRGGAFYSDILKVRSACRAGITPAFRDSLIGFRLVRTISPIVEPVKFELEKKLVLVPAGKFLMGSLLTEKGIGKGETQHEVTITQPFYMGKYEVTHEDWEEVMGNRPRIYKSPNLPVTDVSWEDCQEFLKKLNGKTKGGYRLPTEAEWEYACRAGSTTVYSFGAEITGKDANCLNSKIGRPVTVGSYKPNAFGLFDMHGNVSEWCEDFYGNYTEGSVTDPKGPATGTRRVIRGGSFGDTDLRARSSNRENYYLPNFTLFEFGFRLAKTK